MKNTALQKENEYLWLVTISFAIKIPSAFDLPSSYKQIVNHSFLLFFMHSFIHSHIYIAKIAGMVIFEKMLFFLKPYLLYSKS